jgi:hypothetical protein
MTSNGNLPSCEPFVNNGLMEHEKSVHDTTEPAEDDCPTERSKVSLKMSQQSLEISLAQTKERLSDLDYSVLPSLPKLDQKQEIDSIGSNIGVSLLSTSANDISITNVNEGVIAVPADALTLPANISDYKQESEVSNIIRESNIQTSEQKPLQEIVDSDRTLHKHTIPVPVKVAGPDIEAAKITAPEAKEIPYEKIVIIRIIKNSCQISSKSLSKR